MMCRHADPQGAMFSYMSVERRPFCEMLDYNLLFRWCLEMNPESSAIDRSAFSENRKRLIEHDSANRFFAQVVQQVCHGSLPRMDLPARVNCQARRISD